MRISCGFHTTGLIHSRTLGLTNCNIGKSVEFVVVIHFRMFSITLLQRLCKTNNSMETVLLIKNMSYICVFALLQVLPSTQTFVVSELVAVSVHVSTDWPQVSLQKSHATLSQLLSTIYHRSSWKLKT